MRVVKFMFLLQAVLCYLPAALWRLLAWRSGALSDSNVNTESM